MASIILLRGAGDLATGVAIRLMRCGLRVVLTELKQPLAVRRTVSFAEAIYAGQVSVEGITAQRVEDPSDSLRIISVLGRQNIPVLVDPDCLSARALHPAVIVDGRMTKQAPTPIGYIPSLYIGLGPGFEAGVNCQAVVETRRGHTLGRVYFHGAPEPDTGSPDGLPKRVLRAPCAGVLKTHARIGDMVKEGDLLAEVESDPPNPGAEMADRIFAPISGLLRGLLHPGLPVTGGMKVGDIDPRQEERSLALVSDKALAIGGGVLEAILSRPELRAQLWN
jgi:xanthine dehydrogenase accessory factor